MGVMEREGREKEYYDTQMKMTGGEDDADDATNLTLEFGDNSDDPVTAAASKKDPLDYWTDKLEKELKQKFFEDEDNNDDDTTAENINFKKKDKDVDMDKERSSKNGDDGDIDSSKYDGMGIDEIIRNLIVDDVEDAYW